MVKPKLTRRTTAKNKNKYTMRAAKTSGECSGYCVKCRKPRDMLKCRRVTAKNGRNMMKGICSKCQTKMNKFV